MARDKRTAAYAEHRAALALGRARDYGAQARYYEERAASARSKSWRTRWGNYAAAARRGERRAVAELRRWRQEAMERQAREQAMQEAARRRRQRRQAKRRRREEEEEEGPSATEFVVAVDYEADAGASSDVDLQWHLRREDGAPMREREARAAFAAFVRHRDVPDGYQVAAVDWKRPRATGWRGAREPAADAPFTNFFPILTLADEAAFRFGGLKDD